MQALVTHFRRIGLLAVLTLSLVATGFAHRMPDADVDTLVAMAAAGASPADLCGQLGQSSRHANALCQACQIAGGADLPPEPGGVEPAALVLVAAIVAPRENRRVLRVLDLSRTAQGPPLV